MAKYTQKLVERIVYLIQQDLYTITEICDIVKVNRKTFYEWRNTKPEFRQETDLAMERRDEMLLSIARISLKQKLEGYTVQEEKITYEPAPANHAELREKSRVVRKKQYPPDLSAIKYVMERQEKKKQEEKAQPEKKQNIIYVQNLYEADLYFQFEKKQRGTMGEYYRMATEEEWKKFKNEELKEPQQPPLEAGLLSSGKTASNTLSF